MALKISFIISNIKYEINLHWKLTLCQACNKISIKKRQPLWEPKSLTYSVFSHIPAVSTKSIFPFSTSNNNHALLYMFSSWLNKLSIQKTAFAKS